MAKEIWRKKDKAGGIILPEFKLYYKAIIIKIDQYWYKDRRVDYWNRIQSPKTAPCING